MSDDVQEPCTHEHTRELSIMWPGYDECLDCGAVTR